MAKIFITGATGQVGGQLVSYLLKENKLGVTTPSDIICLVRNPSKADLLKQQGVTVVKGDLQDNDTICDVMNNGISHVFHVAADININHNYEQMYPPNVLGTRIMLDAFVNSGAECFIFTSSIAVYDVDKKGVKEYFITEESNIGKPEGLAYAVTKRLAEAMVTDYCKNYPEKTFLSTRLGGILGPGDRQTLPNLVGIMKYRLVPKLINRGKFVFSLTSPYDVARAQVFLAEKGNGISGEFYNVANEVITFREVMNIIARYYYRPLPRLSITFWFFKVLLPFIKFLHKIFPKAKLLKTAMSETTAQFIGRSYYYSTKKLTDSGFSFSFTPEEAILSGLEYYDPEKKLVKPSKRIMWKSKRQKIS